MPEDERRAHTEPANRGLQRRFEQAVDQALPNLDPAERAKRIAKLKSAYYVGLVAERQRRDRERERAERKAAEPPRPLHPRFEAAMQAAFGEDIQK